MWKHFFYKTGIKIKLSVTHFLMWWMWCLEPQQPFCSRKPSARGCVSAGSGCCSKVLEDGRLTQNSSHFVRVLETWAPRWGCHDGWHHVGCLPEGRVLATYSCISRKSERDLWCFFYDGTDFIHKDCTHSKWITFKGLLPNAIALGEGFSTDSMNLGDTQMFSPSLGEHLIL